jgi:hypothetical protein
MRSSFRFLIAAAVLATATIAARADAIAGVAGGGGVGAVEVNNSEGVSWTQTGSYTDVTISAFLSSATDGALGTGTIYLTDQIGPGTTVANQIAETTVSGLAFPQLTATSLFSGLDLGPGTYYLITASNFSGGGGLGWTFMSAPPSPELVEQTNPTSSGLAWQLAIRPQQHFYRWRSSVRLLGDWRYSGHYHP